ncbi:hypothetical protein BKA93DRAFT_96399 [Sparassis latifolia]
MSDAPVSAFLGQENVTRASCRVSNLNVAWNIILFFGANIIAHALTITIRSGQKAWKTFLVSCGVIFSPFIVRMNYSEAMMDVLDAWRNRWREARTDISWKERLHVAIFGNKDSRWPLQTAIDSGAVAIEVPKDRRAQAEAAHWQVVDMEEGIALFVDGLAVSEETEYRLIPVGAKSESEIQVAPSSSVLKTVVTIAQLLYTSIELYQSYDRDVRMNGLSSPFIVIIPYVVGSFMNLIINIFLVSYPYVVVMRPKSREGITTTKSEMPEPVPSAPQPEKPSSDHEEVALPSFPSYDSDKDNDDTSSLSEAFVSRPSDHRSVRSASEEMEPEKPTASRPGTLSHTESEPLLHNMASSRAEEGLPLPVTALKTEKAVDVAAADSDLQEFLAWVYETYDLHGARPHPLPFQQSCTCSQLRVLDFY